MFPVAPHAGLFSFFSVDTANDQLAAPLRDALLRLLDDPSPSVRQALLADFARRGGPAVRFLRAAAGGTDPAIAPPARWFLEQLRVSDPIVEFKDFIRSLHYELETGLLLLARTVSPDLDPASCCLQLDALAARCRELLDAPAAPREQCLVLNRVLFQEFGLHGNVEHYADPRNSLLDQVLVRRTGIPLSLCTVYLLVAQRVGLNLEPVGLPGHFLVGCYVEGAPFFIDAFDQGAFRTAEEIFAALRASHIAPRIADLAPTPVREVLCRACRNLVNHYAASGDTGHARLFAEFVEEFETTYERHTT
jgi:regulator of sirC expression with transglutaminase-like and TPR domain